MEHSERWSTEQSMGCLMQRPTTCISKALCSVVSLFAQTLAACSNGLLNSPWIEWISCEIIAVVFSPPVSQSHFIPHKCYAILRDLRWACDAVQEAACTAAHNVACSADQAGRARCQRLPIHSLYRLYFDIADGMVIARVGAWLYSE